MRANERASERLQSCVVEIRETSEFARVGERGRERKGEGEVGVEASAFDRPWRILRRFHRLIESSASCCDRDRIVYADKHASYRIASHRSLRFNDSNEHPADICRISLVELKYRLITHFGWIDNSSNPKYSLALARLLSRLCSAGSPVTSPAGCLISFNE